MEKAEAHKQQRPNGIDWNTDWRNGSVTSKTGQVNNEQHLLTAPVEICVHFQFNHCTDVH